MTLDGKHRHEAGGPESCPHQPPDRRAGRAPLRRGEHHHLPPPLWKACPLRSGGVIASGGAVGKLARRRPPDRRAWRAPLQRGEHDHLPPPLWKACPLRSGGVIASGGAVGKLARRRPPDRRAWRAPLQRGEHDNLAPPWRKACPLRSGVIAIGGAVGKPARRRPPDRRAWRAPLRRRDSGATPRDEVVPVGWAPPIDRVFDTPVHPNAPPRPALTSTLSGEESNRRIGVHGPPYVSTGFDPYRLLDHDPTESASSDYEFRIRGDHEF